MGRVIQVATTALLIAATGCSVRDGLPVQPSAGGLDQTGLEGIASNGPIQPVCRERESCDAPLHASFLLQQDGRTVGRFASDRVGHFLIYAAPGMYIVVPEQPIGLTPQALEVQVAPTGLTHMDLVFDTGIR